MSSILAGVIAGYVGSRFKRKNRMVTPPKPHFLVWQWNRAGGHYLSFAKPAAEFKKACEYYCLADDFVNGIGAFIFLSILQSVIAVKKSKQRRCRHTAYFSIADQTFAFLPPRVK
ncbi:hypothetical protein ACEQPO_21460 [Bacillus sp. SL00103]